MNRDKLFEAVEKKFGVEEVAVFLFADHSGHFSEVQGLDMSDKALLCFDNFDTLSAEKIEEVKENVDKEYWIY